MAHNQQEGSIIHQTMTPDEQNGRPAQHLENDAVPDPEPAAPSLSEPDPGVFHHTPGTSPETSRATEKHAE